jgi:hypothetical protein
MELHELEVLQERAQREQAMQRSSSEGEGHYLAREAGAGDHRVTVAGARVRGGAAEVARPYP